MASLWFPGDDRLALAGREPNLLLPGHKPTGDVEIDWTHPLTKKLEHFICPLPNHNLDLVGWPVTITLGTNVTHEMFSVVLGELVLIPVGSFTTGQLSFSSKTKITSADDITTLATAVFEPATFNRDLGYISFDGGAWCWLDTLSSVLRTSVYNNAYNTDDPINAAGIHNYGIIWRANNVWRLLSNGRYTTTGTATRRPFTSGEVLYARSKAVFTNTNSTTELYSGSGLANGVVWQGVWSRALTEEETRAMYENPYQILKPKNSSPFLINISSAAALPTLSSATAINITSGGFQPRVTATY